MIKKIMRVKFVKYLQIGHNIESSIKAYLNDNTQYKDEYNISHCIYEFRLINGKRFVYKKPYTKTLDKNIMADELIEMIKPIKDFLDVVIVSIEMI